MLLMGQKYVVNELRYSRIDTTLKDEYKIAEIVSLEGIVVEIRFCCIIAKVIGLPQGFDRPLLDLAVATLVAWLSVRESSITC